MSTHHGKELEDFINQHRAKDKGELNVVKVANLVGVTRTTIYNWIKLGELDLDTLNKLKNAIGFVPGLKPETNTTPVKFDVKKLSEPGLQVQRPNIIRVPLHAVGGFLQGYKNKVFLDMLEHYSMPGFIGEYWDFEIEGMSMYKADDDKSAKPGDRLLCKKMEGFQDLRKEKGYILQTIEGLCYKLFDKIKDDRAYFHSLNKDFDGINFHLKEIKAIYYVDFIIRKQN